MKTFVIYYEDIEGEKAEYWLHAEGRSEAISAFKRAGKLGELDYPCHKILDIRSRDY